MFNDTTTNKGSDRISIYLNIQDYLAQWFIHETGGENPVHLKRGSAESDILEYSLTRLPEGELPDIPKDYNLALVVPYFKQKDPRVFNHLTKEGKKALENTIYRRFRMQLWEELHRVDNAAIPITDLVNMFMANHGIKWSPETWETIRQMYLRKRKTKNSKNNKKLS